MMAMSPNGAAQATLATGLGIVNRRFAVHRWSAREANSARQMVSRIRDRSHGCTPVKNLDIGILPIDGLTGVPSLQASTGATTPGDLAGNLFALDPDGSPFATRLENLAFDGRATLARPRAKQHA
jgi:hypothetical protein